MGNNKGRVCDNCHEKIVHRKEEARLMGEVVQQAEPYTKTPLFNVTVDFRSTKRRVSESWAHNSKDTKDFCSVDCFMEYTERAHESTTDCIMYCSNGCSKKFDHTCPEWITGFVLDYSFQEDSNFGGQSFEKLQFCCFDCFRAYFKAKLA
jgi:hypothetical protein